MLVDVALFVSPYCDRCATVRQRLRAALRDTFSGETIHFEECNVLEHLDRAVQLRVTMTPSLVVNNTLLPLRDWRPATIRDALVECITSSARHTS